MSSTFRWISISCVVLFIVICGTHGLIAIKKIMTPPDSDLKLELVQVLFRHGARTPINRSLKLYHFNDPSVYEPWGVGELTNRGKQQSYELGSFLRNRYDGYLDPIYKAKDVYAYSSDQSRSKMTLGLVLAGLYPPVGPTVWNPSLMWSPIPYLSAPAELDYLLRGHETRTFMKHLFAAFQSKEIQQKYAKYADVLKLINEKTGVNVSASVLEMRDVFDVLIADDHMGLPVPDWYTPEVKQAAREMNAIGWDGTASTIELKKTIAGPIINEFIRNMDMNESGQSSKKIHLYSAHDVNVAVFSRAHNISELRDVYFRDALIFEKLRDSKNQVYVRMLSFSGEQELKTLKLGDHEEFCPIEDYLKIVKPVILTDEEADVTLSNVDVTKLKEALFRGDILSQWD